MKKQLAALCLMASFFGQAQNTVSEHDKKFAKCAAEAGMKEIKLGELALSNGSSTEVKGLGQMMIDDHSKAAAELAGLAQKKGVALPTTMNAKDQKAYDKLSKKQGVEFDKAYAKCMVKDHKKAVCLFKKETKKGSDSEMKTFAANTEPTLQHHLDMSKSTCKAVRK